jgi:hypothetical protein
MSLSNYSGGVIILGSQKKNDIGIKLKKWRWDYWIIKSNQTHSFWNKA